MAKCPTCGINDAELDMTEEETSGLPFEQIRDCTACSVSVEKFTLELLKIHAGLLEDAEKRHEICPYGFVVKCPQCHVKQISAYDKIYTFAYQRCVDCTPENELEMYSDAVFKVVGAI